MKKWNLSLTYEPKIEAVKNGICNQTIRVIGKDGPKQKGDLVSFHGWQGRPYYSSWSWRMPYKPITEVKNISLREWGILFLDGCGGYAYWRNLSVLASEDGIIPPTGEALRDVLIDKNGKIPADGIKAQIIRWNPAGGAP